MYPYLALGVRMISLSRNRMAFICIVFSCSLSGRWALVDTRFIATNTFIVVKLFADIPLNQLQPPSVVCRSASFFKASFCR